MEAILKVYVLVYMVIFFLTAMVLPSYLLYKRTGVNPVAFGKGAETAHDYIGVLFKLIFLVVAIYGICNSLSTFRRITFMSTTAIGTIGILLSIAALFLIVAAQRTMANSWRIGIDERVKTKLVISGIFKYVRNPIFSGMLLVLVSLFFIIPTYFMAYMVVVSYIIISIQSRLEEEYLTRVHGEKYREYKKRVGRFVPKIF